MKKRSKMRQVALKRRKRPTVRKRGKRRVTERPAASQGVPDWFTKLPYKASDHGSNAHQKRLWRLVSEYVRQRDFKQYGKCVSCGKHFTTWMEGQAGHFKAWSVCSAMFKYNDKNLALICASCNFTSDGIVNARFADEMRRRHGEDYVEWIEAMNANHRNTKIETADIVQYAEEIIRKRATLL